MRADPKNEPRNYVWARPPTPRFPRGRKDVRSASPQGAIAALPVPAACRSRNRPSPLWYTIGMNYGKWTDMASSEWEDEQETYLDQEAEEQWQAILQDRASIWERDFANLSEEARESLRARLDDFPENTRGVLQCILRARGLPPCDEGFPTIMPPEAYTQKRLTRLYAKLQLDETMREGLRRTLNAMANLYGAIGVREIWEWLRRHRPGLLTEKQFFEFMRVLRHDLDDRNRFVLLSLQECHGNLLAHASPLTARDRILVNRSLVAQKTPTEWETSALALLLWRQLLWRCEADLDVEPDELALYEETETVYEPTAETEAFRAFLSRPEVRLREGLTADGAFTNLLFQAPLPIVGSLTALDLLDMAYAAGVQVVGEEAQTAFAESFHDALQCVRRRDLQGNRLTAKLTAPEPEEGETPPLEEPEDCGEDETQEADALSSDALSRMGTILFSLLSLHGIVRLKDFCRWLPRWEPDLKIPTEQIRAFFADFERLGAIAPLPPSYETIAEEGETGEEDLAMFHPRLLTTQGDIADDTIEAWLDYEALYDSPYLPETLPEALEDNADLLTTENPSLCEPASAADALRALLEDPTMGVPPWRREALFGACLSIAHTTLTEDPLAAALFCALCEFRLPFDAAQTAHFLEAFAELHAHTRLFALGGNRPIDCFSDADDDK